MAGVHEQQYTENLLLEVHDREMGDIRKKSEWGSLGLINSCL